MIKRILLTFITSAAAFMASAFDMFIVTHNSDSHMYDTSAIKSIVFSQSEVTVTLSDESTQSFSREEFNSLRFDNNTALGKINANQSMELDGNILRAKGAIEVYDLNGRVCLNSVDGTVDLGNLENGVYVAKSGDETIKIVVK